MRGDWETRRIRWRELGAREIEDDGGGAGFDDARSVQRGGRGAGDGRGNYMDGWTAFSTSTSYSPLHVRTYALAISCAPPRPRRYL